ncbi:DNA-binding NarL/FixJ family response regulator [Mycetocola sp. CAN_C7]|uniref:response regulator transcription factor n=1 Tax=Mycetocola sp. CAN_C7 TaxID=2787724 RepID=UPI0018CBD9CF
MTSLRVIVLDDHDLFREGLVALLEKSSEIVVVGEANNSWDAVPMTRATTPNVVLLDIDMPGPSAYTTVRALKRTSPATHVVILTMHADRVLEAELVEAGASAYLTKSLRSSDLILALQRMGQVRRPEGGGNRERPERRRLLSAREDQVLQMLGRAMTNAAIAESLSIQVGTVKRHVSNLYSKLGATSRIDALNRATRIGLTGEPPRSRAAGATVPHGNEDQLGRLERPEDGPKDTYSSSLNQT